jgi:hypothetical protein
MKAVSPVRLAAGFTKDYLLSADQEGESRKLVKNIEEAVEFLKNKKIVIAEGTGHPGVGGIVNLSNADVSNLIGANIIYLSGGGLGKALDMLEVDLTFFLHNKCRVKGIIFNKIIPEKLPQIKKLITEELLNRHYPDFSEPLKIFGYLPEVGDLYKPSMTVVRENFKNHKVIGNPSGRQWETTCNETRVISLSPKYLASDNYVKCGDIVITGAASLSRIYAVIKLNKKLCPNHNKGIGGLILTCGKSVPLDKKLQKVIAKTGIPAIFVMEDTAKTEEIVLKCFEETKLQVFDSHKIEEVEELFLKHFDFPKFAKAFNLELNY